MRHALASCLILIALVAGGCCQVTPIERTPLPPPITLEEQARRLTQWAQAMPMIRATSVPLGVRIDYQDEKGQKKSSNAEGTLLIRQHLAEQKSADVLLLGKAFDQPVFEAGRNEKDWWFLIRMETKTAWTGDATRPVIWTSTGRSESILRADLVPDLLGLSQLPMISPNAPLERWPKTIMRVNDAQGTNDLLVLQQEIRIAPMLSDPVSFGPQYLARELLIDRRTGNLREVRIYDPAGIVTVRSELADYRPVTFAGDVPKPAYVPAFPRKITVTYPAQHMTIALQFDRVLIPATLPPAAFNTPDYEKERLKVIKTD